MAESASSEAWDHTASLIAAECNTAFGRKGKPIDPRKIHPYARDRQPSGRRMSRAQTEAWLDAAVGLAPKRPQ